MRSGEVTHPNSEFGAIVLVAYNRPLELRRVLSSIQNSQRDNVNELIIVLQTGNSEVENICKEVKWIDKRIYLTDHKSKSIKLKINSNVHRGLKAAFENRSNQWAALIEDDIVLAEDYFNFVGTLMNRFSSSKKFFGVNGFSGIPHNESNSAQYGKYRYGFGWGWAINRHKWEQLSKYWSGNEDFHWDGLIEPIVKTGFVVMPFQSRILNIGFNERASHTFKEQGTVVEQEQKLLNSFVKSHRSDLYEESERDLKWRNDCRVYLDSRRLRPRIINSVYLLNKCLRVQPRNGIIGQRIKAKVNTVLELILDRLYHTSLRDKVSN